MCKMGLTNNEMNIQLLRENAEEFRSSIIARMEKLCFGLSMEFINLVSVANKKRKM